MCGRVALGPQGLFEDRTGGKRNLLSQNNSFSPQPYLQPIQPTQLITGEMGKVPFFAAGEIFDGWREKIPATLSNPRLRFFSPFFAVTQKCSCEVPEVDEDRCSGCGSCRNACPHHAIEMEFRQAAIALFGPAATAAVPMAHVLKDACVGCGLCASTCPSDVIACAL